MDLIGKKNNSPLYIECVSGHLEVFEASIFFDHTLSLEYFYIRVLCTYSIPLYVECVIQNQPYCCFAPICTSPGMECWENSGIILTKLCNTWSIRMKYFCAVLSNIIHSRLLQSPTETKWLHGYVCKMATKSAGSMRLYHPFPGIPDYSHFYGEICLFANTMLGCLFSLRRI